MTKEESLRLMSMLFSKDENTRELGIGILSNCFDKTNEIHNDILVIAKRIRPVSLYAYLYNKGIRVDPGIWISSTINSFKHEYLPYLGSVNSEHILFRRVEYSNNEYINRGYDMHYDMH